MRAPVDLRSCYSSDQEAIPFDTGIETSELDSGMNRSAPRLRYAADDDWDLYRGIIVSHYVDDDLPLRDVMRLMEDEHGFRSTSKIYKTKISEWKVQKYLTRAQREAAAQLAEAFKTRHGCTPKFTLNGRPVPIARVRRRSGVTKLRTNGKRLHTPSHRTRSPSSSVSSNVIDLSHIESPPRSPAKSSRRFASPSPDWVFVPPSEAGDVDKLLRCTTAFAKFCADTYFPPLGQSPSSCSANATSDDRCLDGDLALSLTAAEFWSSMITVLNDLEMRNQRAAFTELDKACQTVSSFMQIPPTSLFRYLLLVLGNCRWQQYPDVHQHMLCYLSHMALEKLPNNHPVAIALNEIRKPGALSASAEIMMKIATHEAEVRLGPAHTETIWFKRSLARVLRRQGDEVAAETVLHTAKDWCEALTGRNSLPTCLCLEGLGQLYMLTGRLEDAEAALTELVRNAGSRPRPLVAEEPEECGNPTLLLHGCSLYVCKSEVCGGSSPHGDVTSGIDHAVLYAKRNLSFLAQARGDEVMKHYWLAQEFEMIKETRVDEEWTMARRRYQEQRLWETGNFKYMTQLKGHTIRMDTRGENENWGGCMVCIYDDLGLRWWRVQP